ncbi:4Fe-4S dicluster domain-containing protein [Candidatus Woesearchaeota archaeon]|nr:4Fe-4S dicluster domain-containing protein [Candidatus Woesearchaeota archaeon]
MTRINFEFRKKVLEEIPELKKCFQCGTCVSSCYAEKYIGSYSPRKKILGALYGDKEVLSKELWKCATCNACDERCPQGVNPYEVLTKLKNIAVRENICPESFREKSDIIIETGYAFLIDEKVNNNRKALGLKEIKPKESLRFVKNG